MRVEIVTDTFLPDVNGVAMTLGKLSKGLRKRGHEVHVIHTAERETKPNETHFRGVALPGYQEVRVGFPKPFRFKKLWKKSQPDVVYVATESPMGASAVKTCKKMSIPVVMGFHTNFDQYLSRYHLDGIRPYAVSYLRKLHAHADRTLVPTVHVQDRLQNEGFERLFLLGRGVDTKLFTPSKRSQLLRSQWGARPASSVAMVVGRVAAEKNLELAMLAFEAMRQRFPDLICVVVGDGPLRNRLEKSHPWVHFAGMQKGDALGEHYASADILLFPSETETFGNVLLEGMASKLVTVSYDYAASYAHVEHEKNGLKVPLGDASAFIEASIKSLNLLKWTKLRDEARTTALKQDWDVVVATFEQHLHDVIASPALPKEPANLPNKKTSYRTVFLSDIHLGTPDSKADEVTHFLKNIHCETLVLNGDIIDGWALRRGGRWLNKHTKFIRQILRKIEKEGMKVIYLRGNHDEILDRFLPLMIGGLELKKEYIHQARDGRNYLVVHGDGFDQVSTNYAWVAHLGSVGYGLLLRFNRIYNWFRKKRGKEYYSLSKAIKAKVKGAVSFAGKYEEQLQKYARSRNCDGIICGHIHTPEDKMFGDIHYLNSGDWVESLTGIVEHHDGRFELIDYQSFFGSRQKNACPPKLLTESVANSERESLAL